MTNNYLIVNGKRYTVFEFLVTLIIISYLLTSLYLFLKIIPELILNLENSGKAISDLELSIIEMKKNNDLQIKELQNTISLLQKDKNMLNLIQEDKSSEFYNNIIKNLYNINWKYVVYFLTVTGVCIYGYSLYNNFNLILYLGEQTNNLLYFLGVKDQKVEFIFSNPDLSEHIVRAVLKNKSIISDISVRHVSSHEFTPILDYLKKMDDIIKNTNNNQLVESFTKEVNNLVINRSPRR